MNQTPEGQLPLNFKTVDAAEVCEFAAFLIDYALQITPSDKVKSFLVFLLSEVGS